MRLEEDDLIKSELALEQGCLWTIEPLCSLLSVTVAQLMLETRSIGTD